MISLKESILKNINEALSYKSYMDDVMMATDEINDTYKKLSHKGKIQFKEAFKALWDENLFTTKHEMYSADWQVISGNWGMIEYGDEERAFELGIMYPEDERSEEISIDGKYLLYFNNPWKHKMYVYHADTKSWGEYKD